MNTLRVILLVVIIVALFESVEMKKTKKQDEEDDYDESATCQSCTYSEPECTNYTIIKASREFSIGVLRLDTKNDCQNACNQVECERFIYDDTEVNRKHQCILYSDAVHVKLPTCDGSQRFFQHDKQNCVNE